MDSQGSAQGFKLGVRLNEKEGDVAEEEQLERLEIGFTPAGEVFRGKKAGPGYQRRKAPKDARLKVCHHLECFT